MRKLEMKINAISLTPRTVRVDSIWYLNSSNCYAGIIAGSIKVLRIIPTDELPEGMLESWADADDVDTDWQTEYWVAYEYQSQKLKAEEGTGYLPVSVFEDHISCY